MITINVKAGHVGFIAALLKGKSDLFPLFKRMSVSSASVPTDMAIMVPVQLTEGELITIMNELTRAPEGITNVINNELKVTLMSRVSLGIIQEGPQLEQVVINGVPQTKPTSATDPTPVPVMQPKQWRRIQIALQRMLANNEAKIIAMQQDGWNYLKS